MGGSSNGPTRDLERLLKKLERDPEALALVAALIEKLAEQRPLQEKSRRSIQSK